MFGTMLIYGACTLSGWAIGRKLCLNSLLQRGLVIFTVGSAQICLSVQILSLFNALAPTALTVLTLSLAAAITWLTNKLTTPQERAPFTELINGVCSDLKNSLVAISTTWTLVGMAFFATLTYSIISLLLVGRPLTDIYHFEMPPYWIQHKSILPFPINNPRIIGLAFFTESLALPAFMHARTALIFPFLAALALVFSILIAYALSRRIGCSAEASLGAATLCLGCVPFGVPLIYTAADSLLAAMLSGASVLWLLDSRERKTDAKVSKVHLAISVLTFALACGAKNTMLLTGPLFLIALVYVHQRALLSRPMLGWMCSAALVGCLASGVAWNLFQNYRWFGSPAGSPLLQGTLSRQFDPRAVWTRVLRGTILFLFDSLWVPASLKSTYAELCEKSATLLGARAVLKEDDDYYSFNQRFLTPQKGIGVLGPGFLAPALAAAFLSLRKSKIPPRHAVALKTVIIVGLGSFVLCHIILRWQSVGVLRLIPPFAILSAPLFAILLRNKWLRIWAAILLFGSITVFTVLGTGLVARRFDWSTNFLISRIRAMQNSHQLEAKYAWGINTPVSFQMREDFTKKELYDLFMSRIPQPTNFGFLGGMNAESYFLFGQQFKNRVRSLVDCRAPTAILAVPDDVDYVVWDDFASLPDSWLQAQQFAPFFQASNNQNGVPLLIVYRRGKRGLN
jgi:hypothetical protein